MAYTKVANVEQIQCSSAICVKVPTENSQIAIAIVRDAKGDFHAIDDLCTHGQVSLSEGEVDGDCIECWAHGALFNLKTGQPSLPATEPVKVYPIRIDGTDILVDVEATDKE